MTNDQDTIVALATPNGIGAIAVIRLSGLDAIAIANSVWRGKDLNKQASHTIHFGHIVDGDLVLDEVLASLFVAPRSYTRENVVEISCHASGYIIESIIKLFIKKGARSAKPGEFTLRAFLNGQLDLSQAEAVADLIASNSKASQQVALQQLRGGFSTQLQTLREQLVNFASLIELELDFAEEDVEFANRDQLKNLIHEITKIVGRLIQSFELGEFGNEVIGNPEAIESFKTFKNQYEQEFDSPIGNTFEISGNAVKKQARDYKSVLKLDKNFHIYIHGDKQLIEKGFDDDKAMNFYKVYFKEEA